MATKRNASKKNVSKKASSRKIGPAKKASRTKKTAPKKVALKKSTTKKSASKKDILKKKASKKSTKKKAVLEKLTPEKEESQNLSNEIDTENVSPPATILRGAVVETQPIGNCMCKQKRPGGKFFCFRLVQGRWAQSSGVPFPTKELCEEVCC